MISESSLYIVWKKPLLFHLFCKTAAIVGTLKWLKTSLKFLSSNSKRRLIYCSKIKQKTLALISRMIFHSSELISSEAMEGNHFGDICKEKSRAGKEFKQTEALGGESFQESSRCDSAYTKCSSHRFLNVVISEVRFVFILLTDWPACPM